MYLSHYNLVDKPFQITTDPKFLWLGEKHQEALSTLEYGILENKGFLLLTGEVGTGKTVLINRLASMVDVEAIIATIPDPDLESIDFFNFLSDGFNMSKKFERKGDFLLELRDFLYKSHEKNQTVVLIVDEAQRLSHHLLEEIRLLSNIELHNKKLINIFFVGQNEFHTTLVEERNRAVSQRITVRYNIEPLTETETGDYIRHRLKIAGTQKKIFKSSALNEIYSFSGGVPRLINVMCDHALLTGYAIGKTSIDARIIRECAQELKIPAQRINDEDRLRETLDSIRNEITESIRRGTIGDRRIKENAVQSADTASSNASLPGAHPRRRKTDIETKPTAIPPVVDATGSDAAPLGETPRRRKTDVETKPTAISPVADAASSDAAPSGETPRRRKTDVETKPTAISPVADATGSDAAPSGDTPRRRKTDVVKAPEGSPPEKAVEPVEKRPIWIRFGYAAVAIALVIGGVYFLKTYQPKEVSKFELQDLTSQKYKESLQQEGQSLKAELTGSKVRPPTDFKKRDPLASSKPLSDKAKKSPISEGLQKGHLGGVKELMMTPGEKMAVSAPSKAIPKPERTPVNMEAPPSEVPVKGADFSDLKQLLATSGNRIIIPFGRDSNDIPDSAFSTLDQVAAFVVRHPGIRLRIKGYTDARGAVSYNKRVSEFRATTIKSYLVGKGGNPAVIETYGLGPENPIGSNETPEGRQANRRVELEFAKEDLERLNVFQ